MYRVQKNLVQTLRQGRESAIDDTVKQRKMQLEEEYNGRLTTAITQRTTQIERKHASELQDLQTSLDNARMQEQTYRTELEKATTETTELQKRYDKAAKDAAEQINQLQQFQSKHEIMQTELQTVRSHNESLETDLEKAKNAAEQTEQLQQGRETENGPLPDATETQESLEQGIHDDLESANAKLEKLTVLLDEHLQDYKPEHEALQDELHRIESQKKTLQSRTHGTVSTNQTVQDAVYRNESPDQTPQTEVQSIESDNKTLHYEKSRIESNTTTLQPQLDAARAEVGEHLKDTTELAVHKTESQGETLQNEKSRIESNITTLQPQLDAARDEVGEHLKSTTKLAVDKTESQNETQQNEKRRIESNITTLQPQLDAARAEIGERSHKTTELAADAQDTGMQTRQSDDKSTSAFLNGLAKIQDRVMGEDRTAADTTANPQTSPQKHEGDAVLERPDTQTDRHLAEDTVEQLEVNLKATKQPLEFWLTITEQQLIQATNTLDMKVNGATPKDIEAKMAAIYASEQEFLEAQQSTHDEQSHQQHDHEEVIDNDDFSSSLFGSEPGSPPASSNSPQVQPQQQEQAISDQHRPVVGTGLAASRYAPEVVVEEHCSHEEPQSPLPDGENGLFSKVSKEVGVALPASRIASAPDSPAPSPSSPQDKPQHHEDGVFSANHPGEAVGSAVSQFPTASTPEDDGSQGEQESHQQAPSPFEVFTEITAHSGGLGNSRFAAKRYSHKNKKAVSLAEEAGRV